MKELDNNNLKEVRGGALNATLLNALARSTELVYNIGTQFGSAIRYLLKGKSCR